MIWIMLLIPLVWVAFVKFYLRKTYTWAEAGIHLTVVSALMVGGSFAGQYYGLSDTEILNGQLTGKDRIHDQYTESYQCNCVTTGSGSSQTTTCSTCYEEHYTVDWILKSTLGPYTVKSLDSTFQSVYKTADPGLYVRAKVGDACSKENSYQNYLRAAPNSLKNVVSARNYDDYLKKGMLPSYPKVYSLYKVDRVLDPSNIMPSADQNKINSLLGSELRQLGSLKQVNIVVVITSVGNKNYRYALEKHWQGGKKNDAIVVIGAPEYPEVRWADVITLAGSTGNEMLAVRIRDQLLDLNDLSKVNETAKIISGNVKTHFERMPMAEFEHLKNEYSPPMWLIITLMMVNLIANSLFTWYFHRNDIVTSGSGSSGRFRSSFKF